MCTWFWCLMLTMEVEGAPEKWSCKGFAESGMAASMAVREAFGKLVALATTRGTHVLDGSKISSWISDLRKAPPERARKLRFEVKREHAEPTQELVLKT